MSFAGFRGVGDWGVDERPKDFRNMIQFLDPNGSAPMFALSARANRAALSDPEYNHWEEEMIVPRLLNSTGMSSSVSSTAMAFSAIDGTLFTKGNGLDLRRGDLLMVEQVPGAVAPVNEILFVSTVTDASNIVVQRAASGSVADGIPVGTYIYRIGNVHEEGSLSAAVSSRNPTKITNFAQIFKTALQVTGTADATEARTGPARANERIRKAFEHSASIEESMIWGEKSEVTGPDGEPMRTTRGILRHLSSNLTAWDDTTFTQANMLDFFGGLFNTTAKGIPNQRIAFCGNKFLTKFNEVIATATNTQFQFVGVLKLFGMDLQRYVTPHGEIAFRTHPLFTQNARYSGSCLAYAPTAIHIRPLKGRDTKLMQNIQAPDADNIKDQWMSELGLEVWHESLHGFAHYKL